MDHGPAVQYGPDNAARFKTKLGLILGATNLGEFDPIKNLPD